MYNTSCIGIHSASLEFLYLPDYGSSKNIPILVMQCPRIYPLWSYNLSLPSNTCFSWLAPICVVYFIVQRTPWGRWLSYQPLRTWPLPIIIHFQVPLMSDMLFFSLNFDLPETNRASIAINYIFWLLVAWLERTMSSLQVAIVSNFHC